MNGDLGDGKTYQGNNIQGWMGGNELEWLFEKSREMINVLEVGCWMGRSTHALLSGCPGSVYAVDHFNGSASQIDTAHALAKTEDIHAIFMQNVGHFPNLVVLKMPSLAAAKLFAPKWFDMIFIDGDHEYSQFRGDCEAWMPKCRKLFCGHDADESGVPQVLIDLGLKVTRVPDTTIWTVET
jgi:predicted O-methyltransferase YrrM